MAIPGISGNQIGPFGPITATPNFTTSSSVADQINQSFAGPQINLGSYTGTGATVSGSGGTGMSLKTWGVIALVLAIVGGGWYWYKKKKTTTPA